MSFLLDLHGLTLNLYWTYLVLNQSEGIRREDPSPTLREIQDNKEILLHK